VKYPLQDLVHLCLIPSLGSSRIRSLLNEFKTCERLLSASVRELCRLDGLEKKLARQILQGLRDTELTQKADRQTKLLEKFNAHILTFWDEEYPSNLRSIYNPPVLLYIKGEILPEDNLSVAMVGTRSVTDYGRVTADKLARDLAAKGITIVSGMATGVDSYAHWGALKAGGRTIAVFGNGIDIVYPPENVSLYKEIVKNGAVISEYPFGVQPSRGSFPARNRIISGMTLGTVIVEAGKKSGSLITAAAALEQNREVFAVPGNINYKQCAGTNRLIQNGAAKLVLTAEDVLEELDPKLRKLSAESEPEAETVQLSDSEAAVFTLIQHEPIMIDQLIKKTGGTSAQISALLLPLELKGLIRRLPGNKYVRV